jgi:misacylated tRNA(Ala) deacylase
MSEKNYDPKMHSAEHILNQTMVRVFGCERSKNSHIERKKSKCDYSLKEQPTVEQIAEVERMVNTIIQSKLNITSDFVTKKVASQFLDLSKLPTDAPETLRVVRIGNFDACACIGPHVSNTAEIGVFSIISSDFNDGLFRIRFKVK